MDNTTEFDLALGSGPYLARVENHLDPTSMGRLEVKLFLGSTTESTTSGGTVTVRYLPQFAGQTSSSYEGNDSSNFQDVQKSYGMWFVPPDIGTIVMVIFVNGDINAGYWFGCVPDQWQNHMVPGLAASRYSAMTPEQKQKYMTDNVPVAEFLKRSRDMSIGKPDTFTRPVHPFADRLLAQGLLLDDIRGITSSSARRETPSGVYGISTPGPIDTSPGAKQGQIGYGTKTSAFVSRLGGHTLVMDDGDTQGLNELFRIRTRTGHQILLHNSSDLIYIANAKGTAWIELTSQGKIDMYAADSVSIHTEGDFNLRADRDFNIEAGRNIKMAADTAQLDVNNDFNVVASNNINIKSQDFSVKAGSDILAEAASTANIKAGTDLKLGGKTANLVGATGAFITASGGDLNVLASGQILGSGSQVHWNGPPASAGTGPDSANDPSNLPTYSLPNRSPGSWTGGFYKAADIISIMNRVPTHEPWDHHESVNPDRFSSVNSDVANVSANPSSDQGGQTVDYKVKPAVGTPPVKTGDVEQDNIAAFLWMIRCTEGGGNALPYNQLVFGGTFDSYADHPNIAKTAKSGSKYITSTAAGAYQFLYTTWLEQKKALGLSDFSPANQDKAAVRIIQRKGALDLIKAGKVQQAIAKVRNIWVSLPGTDYVQGNGPKTIQQARAYFEQGNGVWLA